MQSPTTPRPSGTGFVYGHPTPKAFTSSTSVNTTTMIGTWSLPTITDVPTATSRMLTNPLSGNSASPKFPYQANRSPTAVYQYPTLRSSLVSTIIPSVSYQSFTRPVSSSAASPSAFKSDATYSMPVKASQSSGFSSKVSVFTVSGVLSTGYSTATQEWLTTEM